MDDGFTLFLESGFGSAIEDTDYASIDSSQLFFSGVANETKIFQLLVIDDVDVEINETLQLSIGTVLATTVDTATIIIDATTVATILNDDSVILNIADTSASEDATNINFSVSINRAVFGGFTATFETGDGFAISSGSAADFTALTGSGASATVYFVGTANETQIVRVAINDDGIVEADETFSLAITTITNATVDLSNFDIRRYGNSYYY